MRLSSSLPLSMPAPLLAADPKSLFDGKDLTGWEGDEKTWRVEDGAIAGGSLDAVVPRNEFLCTTKTFGDFELKVKFKLLGDKDKANGGVQFRTKRIPKHHEVSGYQADIGQGYWGALYDESPAEQGAGRARQGRGPAEDRQARRLERVHDPGRGAAHPALAERHADGGLHREGRRRWSRPGIIGLQVHGGGKTKVLYKDITIEELPAPK